MARRSRSALSRQRALAGIAAPLALSAPRSGRQSARPAYFRRSAPPLCPSPGSRVDGDASRKARPCRRADPGGVPVSPTANPLSRRRSCAQESAMAAAACRRHGPDLWRPSADHPATRPAAERPTPPVRNTLAHPQSRGKALPHGRIRGAAVFRRASGEAILRGPGSGGGFRIAACSRLDCPDRRRYPVATPWLPKRGWVAAPSLAMGRRIPACVCGRRPRRPWGPVSRFCAWAGGAGQVSIRAASPGRAASRS